jgi:eight-cysteine-cluster-containing protein
VDRPNRDTPEERGDRTSLVSADHPLFDRLEGDELEGECKTDSECKKGGCSGEVCAATSAVTTCEVLPIRFPEDARCGCTEGLCRWYSPSNARLIGGPPPGEAPALKSGIDPKQNLERCGDRVCEPGQKCIGYYGIAGKSGPRFESCEWPCGAADDRCPAGTKCVTVADGPGRVCR